MNDNWPAATEAALDAANSALDALIEVYDARAVPGMIGALVNWAVRNGASAQMARGLAAAAKALPAIDATLNS